MQKIYCSHFSSAFDGLPFYAVAEKCYERLGLILIAVKDKEQQKMYIHYSIGSLWSACAFFAGIPGSRDAGILYREVDGVSAYVDKSREHRDTILPLVSSIKVSKPTRFLLKRKSSIKENILMAIERGEGERDDVLYIEHRKMDQCLADHRQSNHILVCVIADETSSSLNLSNFLEPIRRKTQAGTIPSDISVQEVVPGKSGNLSRAFLL